jgi:hypothetical protein
MTASVRIPRREKAEASTTFTAPSQPVQVLIREKAAEWTECYKLSILIDPTWTFHEAVIRSCALDLVA